jgi:hypothetical protein
MNRIKIKVILDKTKILYIEILGRFSAENDLIKDFL